jgi:hypothetical protein
VEATLSPVPVDGERVGALSAATLDVVNPATNFVIGRASTSGSVDDGRRVGRKEHVMTDVVGEAALIEGSAHRMAGWLTGRSGPAGFTVTGEVPDLPPWL